MLINVTQEHIDNGQKRDHLFCPIALALVDAGINWPWVSEDTVGYIEDDKLVDAPLPSNARGFVICFDTGEPVAPFSFELPV